MVRTQLEVFDREVEFCTIPWSSLTAPRSIRTAVSFLFQDDPFSQEIEGFGTSCPRWMPGYQAFGSSNHGFCRKLKGLKHVWIPPQDPAPTPQPHHRHHPRPSPPPPTSWEPPRQSVRQQQKSFASEQPQVPYTAPPTPVPRRLATPGRVPRAPITPLAQRPPPGIPKAEVGDDLAPPPPPRRTPKKAPPVPMEPRLPLIVEPKTKVAPKKDPTEVGVVEDEEPPELQALPPDADKVFGKLMKESVDAEEKKAVEELMPHNPPGTPPEEPSWPPPSSAPPVQPIPPRTSW
ncbi:unnamed protein product [Durusdinium trenchii]|uniref:RNA pseudouridine synthase YlyB n=2 Tax=Durusdinium trenchii TaxID=1381693 RepID=A0ABP0S0F4_9DINO